MSLRVLGGDSERRRRQFSGPIPTFSADFSTGGGGALPPGATFSRGSAATYYNQSGLLAYAPANLLTFSQDFSNAAWTTTTTTKTTGQIAPDGSSTATLLTSQASGARIQQSTAATTGFPLVYSVYVKAGTSNVGTVLLYDVTAAVTLIQVIYNLNTVTAPGGTITAVGGGWYRVSMTATPAAAAHVVAGYVYAGTSSSIAGDSIYAWGAQIEYGNVATTYTPTTTAAVYGPRFDYDPGNVLQQNLLVQSQTFETGWSLSALAFLTPNVTVAPDGTFTADFMVPNTTVIDHRVTQTVSVNAGVTYTASIYSKAAGYPYIEFVPFTTPSNTVASFTTTSIDVGNGWLRRTCTFTVPTGDTAVQIRVVISNGATQTFAGDGTSGVYIWGAQLNVGSTALPYLATTSTTQAVCAPRGLLIEEARTNLCLQSVSMAVSPWGGADTTATANSTVSPDGTTNATLLTEGSAGTATWFQSGMTITANATLSASVYLKRNNHDWVYLLCSDSGAANGFKCWVNLATGAIGTTGVNGTGTFTLSSIQSVGNGWYRVTITGITSATNTTAFFFTVSATGNNSTTRVSGGARYVYGSQVEAGAFATSYIPTTSATVTRNADNATLTGISSWYNTAQGTVLAQFDTNALVTTARIIGTQNAAAFLSLSNSTGSVSIYDGANISVSTLSVNAPTKAASTYVGSTLTICMNGGTPASGTGAGTFPFSGTTTIGLGSQAGTSLFLNGHIQSFQYYNYVLPTAQMQQVTLPAYIPSPNYTLNFLSGTLPTGLTFTRATTATYYNSAGTLVTAAINAPRFEYDPSTLAPKGLLIEESRTNIQLNSATSTNWGAANATATVNSTGTLAPDGSNTATSVIESATGPSGHYFQGLTTNTLTNGSTYTTSVYAKANGRTVICLQGDISTGVLGSPQFFDLGAGIVVTPLVSGVTSATIQPVGNNWYRCSITGTSTGTSGAMGVWLAQNSTTNTYTGDGVSGAYFWGAQQELGAFPTSYMPTTSSTVTRNADDCVMTGTNFSSWYNANTGTFVASYDKTQFATGSSVVNVDDGTTTNRQVIYSSGGSNVMTLIRNATTASFGTPSLTTVNKVAYAYGGSSVTGILNGGATGSLSASIPTGINRLVIGATAGSANYLNGHIQYMNYYNVTLNLTQLPSLTT